MSGETVPSEMAAAFPTRTYAALTYTDCRLEVNRGISFDAEGTPIDISLYLRRHLTPEAHRIRPGDKPDHIDCRDGAIVSYNADWHNYYHWLIQAAFSAWLARELPGTFVFPDLPQLHRSVLERSGFPFDRAIFLDKAACIHLDRVSYIESCYHVQAVNPSRLLGAFAAEIAANAPPAAPHRRFYISRRDAAKRAIANESAVESALSDRGFEVVSLTGMPFSDQVQLFQEAAFVVAAHGAGLSNIIFCKPGTRIIEFTSSAYLNPCFVRIGQLLDLDYGLHIFRVEHGAKTDWTVDIAQLDGFDA